MLGLQPGNHRRASWLVIIYKNAYRSFINCNALWSFGVTMGDKCNGHPQLSVYMKVDSERWKRPPI